MDKIQFITTLRIGILEALALIEHLYESDKILKKGERDPVVERVVAELNKLLEYSEHAYAEHPSNNLPRDLN